MASTAPTTPLTGLTLELAGNPLLANRLLFGHRHPRESAPFHSRMIAAYTSQLPQVLVKAFRGSAKSTTAEEVMVQGGVFRDFHYGLIVGSTYDRACDRLKSIKHELSFNPKLLTMFGGLEGEQWGADTIILSNGVMVKAIGRGQSARGLKEANTNTRPDFVFFDDLEEEDTGGDRKPVDGKEVWTWINRVLTPALAQDRKPRIRWAGTPLGDNCALEMAAASVDWRTLTVPLYTGPTMGAADEITPSWPDVFPAERCVELREQFERAGDLAGFSQEYLCKSMDNIARTFHADQIRVAPTTAWTPKTLIVDPARTTNAKSARTGYVVTSWLGSTLMVHHAAGAYHSPSQQVETIFQLADAFHPGLVAVEKDGLEEWLMQPIRTACSQRGDILPLEGIRAPRDKLNFIRGLQPFFNAGEVVFAQDFPDLKAELLSFPYGLIDIANALAYAVRLRPGAPVYPGFREAHILHFIPGMRSTLWLALNARPGQTAAVLIAVQDGALHVLNDWVREGPMQEMLQKISMDMNSSPLTQGRVPQIIIPAERASPTDSAGLGLALQRARIQHRTGQREVQNLESLTPLLRNTIAGRPQFTVSPEATWTMNAMAGGYCREERGATILTPKDNEHRMVAQAIEALAPTLLAGMGEDNLDGLTRSEHTGRMFRSMLR